MDISGLFKLLSQLDGNLQQSLIQIAFRLVIFVVLVILSLIIGRFVPLLVNFLIVRSLPQRSRSNYQKFVEPIRQSMAVAGTFTLIALSLSILQVYPGLFNFLRFFLYLATTISVAWLVSRLVRQAIRVYGIQLLQQLGQDLNDLTLIVETFANVLIGFMAVTMFAQSQNFNLITLITGLGVGGVAVAFAAQETLRQLIGTLVLYLDRPIVPGEYVRVNFNPEAEDAYGRVESIGIRSTKIRVAAHNTLIIVPNSVMVAKDIENISRGKKVMALLYLDFPQALTQQEEALVRQIVQDSTDKLFGVDTGSTRIGIFQPEDRVGTRARVSFFMVGSNEDSIGLRKRALEIASASISARLKKYNLSFDMEEPTIYVDSPISI
ncbi:mechanosensitive ion channel protein MscS [Moorena producens PAL-8-15-08-1]|uniref:Mechanosensitive ion channel protein MscS n=1 Tax=Moorena producens PAL-8-15-08-1 TaxID=1458985 RepID=A0A1D8TQQ9_9CYAN|nr:mechanosensitive ion channel domain-containing protein [Moorena producens]AOW99946.1 mechanosensitive ion channel protein MscS [Moorena producens PAL-8-15-08-1]